jgi:hypothetical protein
MMDGGDTTVTRREELVANTHPYVVSLIYQNATFY